MSEVGWRKPSGDPRNPSGDHGIRAETTRKLIGDPRKLIGDPRKLSGPTRFSARPPPRFATDSDFNLWIKQVEVYIQEVGLPEEKKGAELVSLLEDESFRIVSQLQRAGVDERNG